MDEATLQKMAELVKGMHDQGMSVEQIKENLAQMGISDSDIKAIISRAGLQPSAVDIHHEISGIKEAIRSGEAVKPVVQELGEAKEHFERLHKKVDLLHEKHKEVGEKLGRVDEILAELREIKELLLEIKSLSEATKKLQEDLIEVNRRVLARNL